jgi:hypothetical protein
VPAIVAIVRWRLGSASVPQNASSETSPTKPEGAWAVAALARNGSPEASLSASKAFWTPSASMSWS